MIECAPSCRPRRGRRRGESARPLAAVAAVAGVPGAVRQPAAGRPAEGRLRHLRLHLAEVSVAFANDRGFTVPIVIKTRTVR